MTITRQDYYIEYEITSADAGRVEFPFSFPVKEASQIYCFDIENVAGGRMETPIPPSGYLVTAAPDGFPAGGKVTLVSPLSVGHILRIERITPLTQVKVFRNQRDIDPKEIEEALDLVVMAQQEEAGEGDGAVDPEVVAQLQEDVYSLEANKADKSDPRFIDARTPTAHKATHATGGSDAITPASIGAVATTDSRLSNARTPTAHAASHATGAADALTPANIGAMPTAPTDGKSYLGSGGSWVEYTGSGGGGDGPTSHTQLNDRDVVNQHPQAAITGLTESLAAKAPLASPAFTGAPIAPTASASSNSTRIATTEFVKNQNYAPLASPALTGTPTAPTPEAADSSTRVATTAFVKNQNYAPLASPALTGTPTAPTPEAADSSTRVATTEFVKNQGYAIQIVGDIRLWPHRASELPAGWHFCNGGGYSTSSAAGLALAALSASFKSDWGITVAGTTIYLPNLFSGTDGYFLRPVNGSSRLPGNKQADAIRNIVAAIPSWGAWVFSASATGAFSGTTFDAYGPAMAAAAGTSRLSALVFSAANSGVPTAAENRPINIGMTPAIYLGV